MKKFACMFGEIVLAIALLLILHFVGVYVWWSWAICIVLSIAFLVAVWMSRPKFERYS